VFGAFGIDYIPEDQRQPPLDPATCSLSSSIEKDIKDYQPIVERIQRALTKGPFQNQTYNDLQAFLYTIGPRPTGSPSVIKAAKYFQRQMKKCKFSDVRLEPVKTGGFVTL
jgi:hypothetical protein